MRHINPDFLVQHSSFIGVILLLICSPLQLANAAGHCADAAQVDQVRAWYAEHPGMQPAIVSARLGLPEAIVLSALDAEQAAATDGAAFPAVWKAMTEWNEATFMIMKGGSVFEILSGIGPGKPSEKSAYFNVAYVEPLRGHLRPDEFAAIYAVAIPQDAETVARGVIFLDANGASVFSAFISGDSMPLAPGELPKFESLMAMIRGLPPVCPGHME